MAEHNPILDAAAAVNPTAQSDKLAAVEDALASSTSRIVSTIEGLERATAETRTQTGIATSAIQSATAASQIVNTAKMNADLSAQNATIDAFEAMGGQAAQIALSQELAADQKLTGDLLDQKLAQVAKEHTGIQIIDNIINSFATSQLDQTINAAGAKQAQTANELATISASTESIARTNSLTKKTLNEGVLKANFDGIAAEGKLQASQQELKNISANSDSMIRLVGMDQKSVQTLMSVWRTENEAIQVELAGERVVLAREQMAITREKMKLEIPAAEVALERSKLSLDTAKKSAPTQVAQGEVNLAKSEKALADLIATQETLVDSVKRGQQLTGLQVEDKETILFSLNKGGASGEKYIRLQELGGVPNLKLGNSPFEAMDNLRTVSPEGTNIESKAIDFLERVTNTLIAEGATAALQGESQKELTARIKTKFNQVATATAEIHKQNIIFGDTTNLYQAPPMKVIDSFAGVKTSFFYQKVIKPLDMQEINPQKILEAATTAVLAKTVTVEEAANGMEAMFDAAAAYNNTQDGGPNRVGLPNQESYNTILKVPKAFIGGGFTFSFDKPDLAPFKTAEGLRTNQANVNLMDLTDIKSMLVKMIGSAPKELRDTQTNESE